MPSPFCLQAALSARFSLELSSLMTAAFGPCSCSNSFMKARAISGRSFFCFGKRLQHISECWSKNSSQWRLPDTPLYAGKDMPRLIRPPGCLAFLLGVFFTIFWYVFVIALSSCFWNLLVSFIPKVLAVTLVIRSFGWPIWRWNSFTLCGLRRDKCSLSLGVFAWNLHITTSLTQASLVLMRLSNVTVSSSGYTNWMSLFVVLDNLAPSAISAVRDSKFSFASLKYLTGLKMFVVFFIRQPAQLLP